MPPISGHFFCHLFIFFVLFCSFYQKCFSWPQLYLTGFYFNPQLLPLCSRNTRYLWCLKNSSIFVAYNSLYSWNVMPLISQLQLLASYSAFITEYICLILIEAFLTMAIRVNCSLLGFTSFEILITLCVFLTP